MGLDTYDTGKRDTGRDCILYFAIVYVIDKGLKVSWFKSLKVVPINND